MRMAISVPAGTVSCSGGAGVSCAGAFAADEAVLDSVVDAGYCAACWALRTASFAVVMTGAVAAGWVPAGGCVVVVVKGGWPDLGGCTIVVTVLPFLSMYWTCCGKLVVAA